MKKNILLKRKGGVKLVHKKEENDNTKETNKNFVSTKYNPDVEQLYQENIKQREKFKNDLKERNIEYSNKVWKPIGETEFTFKPIKAEDFLIKSKNEKTEKQIKEEIEQEEKQRQKEREETENTIKELKSKGVKLELEQDESDDEQTNDETFKETEFDYIKEQSKQEVKFKKNSDIETLNDIIRSLEEV